LSQFPNSFSREIRFPFPAVFAKRGETCSIDGALSKCGSILKKLRFIISESSIEVAWSALDSFALLAFGNILDFAVFEDGLHLNFTAAGAEKLMSTARSTRVLGNLCHCVLLARLVKIYKLWRLCQPSITGKFQALLTAAKKGRRKRRNFRRPHPKGGA